MNSDILRKINPIAFKEIQEGKCPTCTKEAFLSDFKNQISFVEYRISGMCQKCQDKVFKEETTK